ncbi:SpaA isopeptide-forming pilin-related protein, partial [Bacillus thuringiensis]
MYMLDAFKRGKVSKVMFSVLSLLMLTISTLISPIFAHADDGEPNVVQRASGNWTQMWHEKYNNKGWVYDAGQKYSIETDVIRFGDNSIAYCLEMMLESPNGHSLEEKTRLSDEYYKIMNNGYPVKTPEQLGANSWQEAHYATQVAVWIVNQDVKYSNLTFKNANVKQVVDKILADANNSSDTQDLSFSITPDHIKAEMTPWSTEYRQAGPFTIKTNGNGTFKPEAINAPGKVTFVDSMGNPKTELNSWEPFFAQINSNTPTGSFNIKVTGDMTKTETVWYKSHSGGIQHTTALVTLHKTPTAQNASISWDSNGGFKIKKVDDAGNPLGGAKFDVINWGNQVVRSLTTDSNGMASTDGLWFEDYTVKETQAPDGYELDNTPQKVTVDSKDKTLTFVNRKSKGGFRIHKVDDSNKPLQGVVFTIYGNDGLKMFDRTTDANGIIQLGDLPYGEYHFKESKGLDGYEFDDDVKHITINADSQNKEYKVVNKLISGSIKITKTDEENRPLKGVQFLVYNQNGDVVGEAYTNEQGIATMGNLPYGTYAWLENKGLDGYEAEKKTGSFVVGKDQKDHAVTVINKRMKGGLEIYKIDDSHQPLQGVEFTIYKDGKEFKKVTTGKDGKIKLPDLEFGKYSVKETKGLEGYVTDFKEESFELSSQNRSKSMVVVNKKIKGSLEITKTDDASKPLAGVQFTIYKDGKEYEQITTDANGKIVLNDLPMGKYTFKETRGLEGYVVSTKEEAFEIKNLGDSKKFTVVNKAIKGSIEITKTDDASKPLKGVEFTVYKDGKEYTKVTTNDKGIAEVKDLPYGSYTFKETKGIEGYVPDSTTKGVDIKEDGKTHKYTVINKKIKGNLEITKTDDAKKPLKGVEFTVYDAKDKEVAKVVTDDKGKASVKDLPYGKYYFKETKGLEGYVFSKEKVEFEIKNLNETKSYNVVNKLIRSNIEITKVDNEGKLLEGVEFTIYDSNDKEVAKVVTDAQGKAKYENLPYGKYYFKETKNLEGYVKNGTKYDIDVKQDMQTLKYDVINKKIRGSVEVLKVDADKKEKPLQGVEFTLFDQNNKVVGKPKLTDKDGKVSFDKLAFGKYYIKETKTIKGYNINNEKFPVDIDTDGKVVKHTVTNKVIRGNVELLKVDTENKNVTLKGAEFELRGSNDEVLGKYKTDANGKLVIKDLVFGDYKLIETIAPTGFNLEQTPISFSISEEGKTIGLTKENLKIYGNMEVTKVDAEDNKKVLANAKFEVYNEKGDKVVEGTTDAKGKAKFEHLPYGKYTFKEVVAPEGYLVNPTVFNFDILENGKTVSHKVTDQIIKGDLEVKKVDMADKKGLSDAKFEVFNAEGKKVAEGKTNKDGYAKFEKLPYGKYTFKETVAPKGYFLNETVFNFEIKEDGKIIAQVVENEKVPSIKTTATEKHDGAKEMHTSKEVTITDKVEYKDLLIGKEYTVKGKLMDKETKKPLLVGGKEVTAEATFTPDKATGSINLDFTFDATGLEEKEVVVFEDLIKEGKTLTTHSDLEDKDQTVKFVKPSVSTTATDKADGTKELHAIKDVTIIDVVEYKNLVVGKNYTLKGKLMDKATKQPLVIDGKEVVAEKNFSPREKDGKVPLEFKIDASTLEGKQVVVFEDVVHNNFVIATHADIEDKGQTVDFVKPEVKTTATNKADKEKEIHAIKNITVQDKVDYKNLVVGKEYTVKGKLMVKETNKPLVIEGKEVTAEKTFKPTAKNGSVTLDFTFDASKLEGKELVVFEDVVFNKTTIATHSDIEDKDQTVRVVKPEVHTTATNKADEGKEIHAQEKVTIQDKVAYKDLVKGKEYTVKGKLMDKATNKPFKVDGKEVTAESKFTAKEKDGVVTVDFTFNAEKLQGKSLVVFEDLYYEKELIATHSDIKDEGQTVRIVKPEVK